MRQSKRKHVLAQPLRQAGLAAAVLLAPASYAADCPQPTLAQCSDVNYRASTCGKSYDSYCQGIMESAWKSNWEAAPKRVAIVPPELGGGTATVSYQNNTSLKTTFSGGDGSLVGQISRGQVLYRKGLKNLTKEETAYYKQRQNWDANGTQLTSCQEFVHEKYYDFSRFETEAGVYGDDFRGFYTAAFGKSGIANRKLYSRDQQTLAPIWGTDRVAKNAYFRFVPGPYPKNTEAYVFKTDAAKLANNVEARNYVVPSDAWHEAMSKQLVNTPDDVLNDLQKQQVAFTALLNQRDGVYRDWQRTVESLKGKDFNTADIDKAAASRLYALDKAIEASLVEAQKNGCLKASGATACDWSPRRYKDMVDTAMDARRELDLRACLTLTGNDFSEGSFVRNADKLKLKGLDKKDYTVSSTMLSQYINIYAQYLATLLQPVNAATGLARHGGEASDSGYSGDDTFGGGYDYTAGWEVTTPGAGFTGPWCDTNARVYGHFTATANVFGSSRFEVIHAEGEALTEANAVRLKIASRLLGFPIYSMDKAYPLRVTFAEDKPFVDADTAKASATFMVWFIPVTVQAGISAEVGVNLSIGGAITRDCTRDLVGLDLIGVIKPYTSVNGFASIAIGVPGLQVGVRGTLVIIRVNIPLQGDIGLYLSSPSHPTDPNTLFLHLRSKLDFELRTLDGRISLFGELGFLKGEFTIVSWSGFGTSVNLYDEQYNTPLARLY